MKTNMEKSFSSLSLEHDHAYTVDDNSPLLLYYKKSEVGVCNYFSPALNLSFSIPSPLDLSGTIFRYASNGWLLLSHGEFQLLLANPSPAPPTTSLISPSPTISVSWRFSTSSSSDPNFVVGGMRLFVGYPLSIVSKVPREMRNKVFMSRVHGDPEILPAQVKEFDGKDYFVPQTAPQACKGASACYYPLGNEEEYKYYKSKGYLFSIWYQPN